MDRELRAVAEEHDIAFHRVPVPDDDARFAAVVEAGDPVISRNSSTATHWSVAAGQFVARPRGEGQLC